MGKKTLLLIFVLFIFTGCFHSINKQGLTLSLSQDDLNESFKEEFPIKKDLIVGNIKIYNPNLKILEKSNKIEVDLQISVSSLFTPTQEGFFSIKANPIYKKESKEIFLDDVEITKLKYQGFNLDDSLGSSFFAVLKPLVNEVFKTYPIYEIKQDSFNGRFVKSIKLENKELLVTYGL